MTSEVDSPRSAQGLSRRKGGTRQAIVSGRGAMVEFVLREHGGGFDEPLGAAQDPSLAPRMPGPACLR